MGGQAAEYAGLSREGKRNWPVPAKTRDVPPVPSFLPSHHQPCKEVTSAAPKQSLFLLVASPGTMSKSLICLRPGLQQLTSIPFAGLLGVFYDGNSFCGLIVFLLSQYLQVQGFVVKAVGAFCVRLANGLIGSCPSPVICAVIIQHQNNFLLLLTLLLMKCNNFRGRIISAVTIIVVCFSVVLVSFGGTWYFTWSFAKLVFVIIAAEEL